MYLEKRKYAEKRMLGGLFMRKSGSPRESVKESVKESVSEKAKESTKVPSKSTRISDAEWQVMNVIWNQGKTTSRDIIRQLEKETNWSEMTIRTLIGRLVKKKVAGYEIDKNDKRIYYYYPIIEREQCIKEETNIFLKKFYDGALSSMLSSFVKKDQLTREEMDELINILETSRGHFCRLDN